ncbi:uncharacterized protein PV09_03256 [Verruconis gallopava]|uniref:Uncharacterized protein n=1 Tax=Verruconis gallopava TaxID=253628 RepID=A0A0D2AHQ5_9PEZI|nr:uncharacterized protein PV09_03256 [Verruconis gallopava]KIW06085.1 hypothetical protein PV09_03256 [Verruconis gallopava]
MYNSRSPSPDKIESGTGNPKKSSAEYCRSSYDSNGSYSTVPTAYSTPESWLQRREALLGCVESYQSDRLTDWEKPRDSVETYVSTDASDLEDESQAAYEVLEFEDEHYQSDAIPATPRDFAELFPSSRRLSIHHDDSTIDGNMNLRVDTLVDTEWSPRKENLTLFHLKMNDLKTREFSLRRYCRDSGREVCKTIRKYQPSKQIQTSALTKSLSSVLTHLKRHHDEHYRPNMQQLQRNDSGFDATYSPTANEDDDDASFEEPQENSIKKKLPTNTIKLEFSNYANVELKRRGAGQSKGYQFEYWGREYTWKRTIKREGDSEEVSFHLTRSDILNPLAHIVPVPLTRQQDKEEILKGGWIKPCSMWIADVDVVQGSPDLADVVVATGLVSLVDDTIKRRWHSTKHRRVLLPLIRSNSFRLDMEYVGPKRLIDEIFHRHPVARTGNTRSA